MTFPAEFQNGEYVIGAQVTGLRGENPAVEQVTEFRANFHIGDASTVNDCWTPLDPAIVVPECG